MIFLNKLRLRDLREDHDMTLQDVAKVLGTTLQYYQKYESRVRPIPVERLEILADFYGTSTDYILGRTLVRKPYPKK
ncbi:helix-turn-helix transcriptional regulator [Dysosmobacter welbionis]|uniref:helix-turn-helix domain-containing protein n=1 Tax=Dysosmobacter welbionis TaxID=2093857 RepID=UPI0029421221|nr:helix-turn-helix transcriptional regulator [Dysosmobacter welbionis]